MRSSMVFVCAFSALTAASACAVAEDAASPRLHTNERYVEDVIARFDLAIDDPMAVFTYVLNSLPARVKVYPTENHYYFWFFHGGARYAGNIKIDARLREQGNIRFVYYVDQPSWLGLTQDHEVILDAARGVSVEKIEPLAYRLTYKNKSVVFMLNDLSRVRPPARAIRSDERFIGPVFDESGVRFFLLFNAKLKIFLYILDETVTPTDTFISATVDDSHILIGRRTGFAFYRDGHRDRKILIGVSDANVSANNYFDGPSDQMPDNFIVDDTFRKAILAVEPSFKGEIDRYGALADGARLVVAPYMQYRHPADLAIFHRCAVSPRVPAAQYYRCFVLPLEGDHGRTARPLAMPHKLR